MTRKIFMIRLVIAMVAGLIYQAIAGASDIKNYPPPGERPGGQAAADFTGYNTP